ncbi:HEPN domain-containing protein [Cellulomonas sp. P22]|uniref:HEPN domain-containing protein n=1 Tax=Cellulomonas sp. P22 TaxID=3373189 RepID=UPI0037A108AF
MSALTDARAHLAKAREFLDAADVELSGELYTAATSSSVLAGINAKDAICLRTVGHTNKADDHKAAVSELEASGPVGDNLSSTFRRLIALKTKAQYTAGPIGSTDAHKAYEWATRMVETASDTVAS